jgi:hypothetical protein
MSPVKIIESAFLDGLNLAITPKGQLHYSGDAGVVNRWLPLLRENKTEILVALARVDRSALGEAQENTNFTSCWWRFTYTDGDRKEACYCPPVTRAEALAGEPGAINAESFEPTPRQPDEPLSETDEATVWMWLADIGEDDEGISMALGQCRTNQDAREGFLRLAKQ